MSSRAKNRTMHTGDRKPDLELTVRNPDGTPLTLEAATSIRIIGSRAGVIVVDRAPATVNDDGASSVLTLVWVAGDTALDVVGPIRFEVEATWTGGKKQTISVENALQVVGDADA